MTNAWIGDQKNRTAKSLTQFELDLRDWRPMETAPKNATWVEVEKIDHVVVRAHFAQDLSGEEQPSFSGWFYENEGERWSNGDQRLVAHTYFREVWPKPYRWRPES